MSEICLRRIASFEMEVDPEYYPDEKDGGAASDDSPSETGKKSSALSGVQSDRKKRSGSSKISWQGICVFVNH